MTTKGSEEDGRVINYRKPNQAEEAQREDAWKRRLDVDKGRGPSLEDRLI